jgi:hypothetical protein
MQPRAAHGRGHRGADARDRHAPGHRPAAAAPVRDRAVPLARDPGPGWRPARVRRAGGDRATVPAGGRGGDAAPGPVRARRADRVGALGDRRHPPGRQLRHPRRLRRGRADSIGPGHHRGTRGRGRRALQIGA